MQKWMRRPLSALLSIVLVFSEIPLTALAAEGNGELAFEEDAIAKVIDDEDGLLPVEEGIDSEEDEQPSGGVVEGEEAPDYEVELEDSVAGAELGEKVVDEGDALDSSEESAKALESECEPDVVTDIPEEPALTGASEDPDDGWGEEEYIDLSDATVKVGKAPYNPEGDGVFPTVTVTLNGKVLKEDVDYVVEYWNNYDVGIGTVYIEGRGDYCGSTDKDFFITCPLSRFKVAPISNRTYTGKPIKPSVLVTESYYFDERLLEYRPDYLSEELERGYDYTLTYENNVNVGTATARIKGKNCYTGTKTRTFKIVAAPISKVSVDNIKTQKWTGKAVKPKPVVEYNGITLKAGTDYTLAYKNNVKAGSTATITLTGKGNFKGTKTVTFKIANKPGSWKKSGGRWWYRYSDGTYPTSQWLLLSGTWYYFDGSGWMVTGWRSISGTWYYFNSSGAMVTGWKSIGGSWYHFSDSGAMTRNKWVGNYYLGSSGAMLTSTYTPDGYWVGSNGKWVSGGSGSGSYGTVYWVPKGTVWHSTPECSTLSRSKTILSGTIAQSGMPRGCRVCTS